MRNYKSYITAAAIGAMMLSSVSCTKDFYTKVNTNTNQPTSVPPSTLLSGIEVSLAYAQGGDAARFTGLFTQQGYGWNREQQSYYNYIFTALIPEQLWDNMYANTMENDYALLNMASTNSYNEYAGIANVLMAYSLQATVDMWGNVPYSQAFMGASNLNPKYDVDQSLYGTIITLLNTGIADLKNPNAGALVPTTDDVIYGGSASSWIAFANAIKARNYIHQCKHNNAAMLTNAMAAADSALAEGFTTAQVTFPGAPNSSPVYQFNVGWGDISYVTSGGAHNTMFDTMAAVTDPRINVYFDTAGAAAASSPMVGMSDATTTVNTYYGNATSPVEFITPEELSFIQAEATLRSGGTVVAASVYYANAINENFTKLGIGGSAAAYVIANPLPVTTAGAEHQVAIQEWIALFMNPEEWSTWRRNGVPVLVAPSTAVNTQVPRRMVLPNSEVTENSNAPGGETLWTPVVFWDN